MMDLLTKSSAMVIPLYIPLLLSCLGKIIVKSKLVDVIDYTLPKYILAV